MKNRVIPTKILFSGKDYADWKLHRVDFMPFEYQDEFAENINEIAKIIRSDPMRYHDDLLETLEKAKSFACSTIIPGSKGFSRVFFDTPNDLKNFIEKYQEDTKESK